MFPLMKQKVDYIHFESLFKGMTIFLVWWNKFPKASFPRLKNQKLNQIMKFFSKSLTTRFLHKKLYKNIRLWDEIFKNIVRTLKSFADSRTCTFLGNYNKILQKNAENKNILKTFSGLKPKKLRTSEDLKIFWRSYKKENV